MKYGCNSFVTVPHGSKPVSSNSHINNYSASSCYEHTFFQDTPAHSVVLHTPFGNQVTVSGEDFLCIAELCVSELFRSAQG